MQTASTPAPVGRQGVARAAAPITAWNLVSRVTGFGRVLAVGAALGTTALGDTYQSANLVSNVLFELLAGGVLSAVLVPAFVQRVEAGDERGAGRLAGAVLCVALAGLGLVTALGMGAAPLLMRALTSGVQGDVDARVRLGSFLLLFFLPQVLLYAIGAVATALLQAHHRFVAAAVAPVCNNLVVIATMLAFRASRDGGTGLVGSGSAGAVLLAVGTTSGVLAMTLVPVVALRRTGSTLRPTWPAVGDERRLLRGLLRRGAWAAGHLGCNQVLVAATVVLAARVEGGVVAYQIAFTFFLLPHAILANPLFTALYPRFAADAAAGRLDRLAEELGAGLRTIGFLLLPSAAVLAALAGPLVGALRAGAIDAEGADLVGAVLAAYAVGLVGYSGFFLLTRVAYALDDARTPTTVIAGCTGVGVVAMALSSASLEGEGAVVVLGLIHGAVVSVASIVLLARLAPRLPAGLHLVGSLVRSAVVAAVAGSAAWAAARALDGGARTEAVAAAGVGGLVALVAVVGAERVLGGHEVRELRAQL